MISVIVIAYNAQNTISRCIDSILNQNYRDFELIIIDDGSTDKTLDVIVSYSHDSRIRIRTRENKGVAYTRQEGLDMAFGQYSIFVDADDWVESNFLGTLYECAMLSKAEMVICDMLVERPRNVVEYLCERPKSLQSNVVLGQMICELHGSLCNKLMAQSAYTRTGVRFLPDLDCCEDQYVVMALLAKGVSVAYLNEALYHYDKTNESSITNNWLDFPVDKRVRFIKSIRSLISDEEQNLYLDNYIGTVAYTATASPKSACQNYIELFKEFWPNIKKSQLPKHKKIICYLRLNGIVVPTRWVKMLRRYFHNKLKF